MLIDKGIYDASKIISGQILLKTAPQVILIKSRKLEEIVAALNIAAEMGYSAKASFSSPNWYVRIILERVEHPY
ncbi:MAG: hypothetical protein ACFFCO_08870 [Promethearchaeota archaeon]